MSSLHNPEHDAGVRPAHRPGSFLDKRDRRPTAADLVTRAADPTALIAWEAEHGLTVASVNRYLLNLAEAVTA